ncbi:MAG: hypothetical protein LBH61_04170 [Dysgonamonadaceae bacterium]|jgi:hypothetical protein|nr:hypothetical protein [Dysgonamonadaceae bacterium]
MNKKNRIITVRTIGLMLLSAFFVFTTCQNDDLNTDSLSSSATTLKAFGPNPALRGQKLSFAGTHLNKITKVILPDGIEITDIEVVSDKLIQVPVPQETVGGVVRLTGANGLELVTKDPLTISEPVEITKITPQPVKAGQTLTIEGNYFNLMGKVIFSDKVEVLKEDCQTWERTKITLVVPAEAQTGVVILADNAEIPLEYQSPEPLQVVLPSVDKVLDLTDKKPEETVRTTGSDLDLVVSVEMPDGEEVPFTVEDNTLAFALSGTVSDGAVVMIPASGVRVVVANIGVAVPAGITVTPAAGLRAGDEITVTGINMELVTSVTFPGVAEAVVPGSVSATEIKVNMPEKAISGEITLNTASGKTVAAEIATLKPGVTNYNPSPVAAGSEVILEGHHLDLVVSVTFGGELLVPVTPAAAEQLTVAVPLNALPGVVVLTMANGETVECEALEITAPAFAYLPDPPGPKAEIYAGGVLSLTVENGNQLTDVQINGAPVKYILDNPLLYAVVPNNAKGDTELKLVSSNGTAVYTIPVIGAGIVETVVFEGLHELNWGAGLTLEKDLFRSVPSGSVLKVYLTVTDAGASIAFSDAGWTKLTVDHPDFQPDWGTVALAEGTTSLEIVLTAEILNTILTVEDGWSQTALMMTGANAIVSKVSIIVGSSATEEVVISEETVDFGAWENTLRLNKESFDGVRAGAILKMYITTTGDAPQFALQDANWAKVAIPDDPNFDSQWGSVTVPAGATSYEVVLTQDILDAILIPDDGWSTTAIVLGGTGMIVNKVSVIQ